jgi:SAM-dependent MidA family methyltransferase
VEWLDDFPDAPWDGALIANELLDSLPVHRLRASKDGVRELCVADAGDGFQWQETEPDPAAAAALAERAGELPAGTTTEVALEGPAWVAQAAENLRSGGLLLIDYGLTAAEYDDPARAGGTLLCHYRHRAHDDPFFLPGVQDITAHVDFSAIARAAEAAGLDVSGYTTQAQFLMNLGLAHRVEDALAGGVSDAEQLNLANALKQLTLPGGMGESFKVLLLTRGVAGPFPGFRQGDRAGSL